MSGPADCLPRTVDGIEVGTGTGPTKRRARTAAAKNALAALAEQEADAAAS